MRRILVTLVAIAVTGGALSASPAGAVTLATPTLAVGGAVSAPATYTVGQLRSLPQTTATLSQGLSVTGVALEDLVLDSVPILPDAKNALLRVTVLVHGRNAAVAFAVGELDPDFGAHPALLVLSIAGHTATRSLTVAVPGDRASARTVVGVSALDVQIAAAPALPVPAPGSLTVTDGMHARTLDAATLAALPSTRRTVSFLAGTTLQSHLERGPTLAAVLARACAPSTPATSVAAVADDGYIAAVTPGETTSGARPLLLSLREDGIALAQPRLVADGDLKGGRYVTGVLYLVVSTRLSCT